MSVTEVISLSIEQYFKVIRPYLEILKKDSNEWKIQLIISNNFVSSLDNNDGQKIYTQSDNVPIIIGTGVKGVINKLYESLLDKNQKFIQGMGGSHFSHGGIVKRCYKLHKTSLKSGERYIKTLD